MGICVTLKSIISFHFSFTRTLRGRRFYYPHYQNEKKNERADRVISLPKQSQVRMEPSPLRVTTLIIRTSAAPLPPDCDINSFPTHCSQETAGDLSGGVSLGSSLLQNVGRAGCFPQISPDVVKGRYYSYNWKSQVKKRNAWVEQTSMVDDLSISCKTLCLFLSTIKEYTSWKSKWTMCQIKILINSFTHQIFNVHLLSSNCCTHWYKYSIVPHHNIKILPAAGG